MVISFNERLIYAFEFSFSAPDEIKENENFTVKIEAGEIDSIFDIKIFVRDKQEKIISEIYMERWKNPFYYLKSVFPKQTAFVNIVRNYSEDSEICVRMRESGKNSFTEKCSPIKIISSKTSEYQEKTNDKAVEEELLDDEKNDREIPQTNKEYLTEFEKENLFSTAKLESSEYSPLKVNTQKIVLNQDFNVVEEGFITKKGYIERHTPLFYISLFILIVFLILLRKL